MKNRYLYLLALFAAVGFFASAQVAFGTQDDTVPAVSAVVFGLLWIVVVNVIAFRRLNKAARTVAIAIPLVLSLILLVFVGLMFINQP